MNLRLNKRMSRSVNVLLAGVLMGVWTSAPALLAVPNIPIFLASDVQANIFFSLDDSGSMDWEILKSNGAQIAHPSAPDSGNLDDSMNDFNEDREMCRGYNVLAYNPGATYPPWVGVDDAGNPYVDQSITSALSNPYASTGNRENLLLRHDRRRPDVPMRYGIWTDTDGDGVYDAGECPTAVESSGDYDARTFSDPRWVRVDTLSAADQTKFANWWTYYRKREYVLKRAISVLVNNSQQRMGLATLHDNNSVGTPVRDMRVQADKDALLRQLFRITSNSDTPLRLLLLNTGRYFDDTDAGNSLHSALGFSEGTPLLPSSLGGECQQNFDVLFSDGQWNGSLAAADLVGNTDNGAGPYDGGPHADNYSDTLADVAMKYYETDLSSTLDNTVPTDPLVDNNPQQHLVVYTVSFGLDGTLTAPPVNHDAATPPPPWPQPTPNSPETIDDMRHAAFNARGDYLPGQNAQELIDALNAVLASIAVRTGSASAVAATSTQIQTDTLIFQGRFDTDNWNGRLLAFALNQNGTVSTTEQWDASTLIPAAASRHIFTFVNNGTVLGDEFLWTNLTPAQQALIGSQRTLDYIRGDRSQEVANGGLLRDRVSVLGDIIDSSPVAVTSDVTPPPYQHLPGTEGATFLPFVQRVLPRLDLVYVGANDGMLHAFRTETGVEEFAYVPQNVFDKLATYADTSYPHEFYVDGQLQAGDAFFSGAWHTVLVGALGRGGNALFALDVTDPASFNAGNVLWEVTDAELGMVLGEVHIVRLNTGQWAAVTGNGYNSTSEQASLFIIDLADGSIIRRIDTGVGGPSAPNGLGEVLLVDQNEDLTADIAYAGDLQGNVWKFDLTATSASGWSLALGGSPLYTARDTSGAAQAITTRPSVIPHPDGGLVVLFGTGRYFVTGDDAVSASPPVDTFYGIRDQGSSITSITTRDDSILQSQEIIFEDTVTFTNPDTSTTEDVLVRALSDNAIDWANQDGWYLDLVYPLTGPEGERVIADPQVRFGRVIFNTFVPSESCQNGGGRSFLMEFDALTGARLDFSVFDLNNDGSFDALEYVTLPDGTQVPVSGKVLPLTLAPPAVVSDQEGTTEYKITSGLEGSLDTTSELGSGTTLGRQSWRQVR